MIEQKRLVVAGDGLDAWMAAALLEGILNEPRRRLVDVRVVAAADPSRTPSSAPAEASRPGLGRALAVAGIDTVSVLQNTGATFNQALKFTGWQGGAGFYHPFHRHHLRPLDTSAAAWLRSDRSLPFAATVSPQPALCESGVGPLPLPGQKGSGFAHGFHVDTDRLAALFRDAAVARGIDRVTGTIAGVERDDHGNIAALLDDDGQRIEGDLFVDATGPDGVLIGGHLGVPWVDCRDVLPCDAELTVALDYARRYPGNVNPFCEASVAGAGWIRDIPLQDRRVLGYVHSSAQLSADDAFDELSSSDSAIDESTACLRSFPVGYRARPWVGNCIAVGAAAASVEPLEATALYFTEFASFLLAEHFPLSGDTAPLAWRFNRIFEDRCEEIIDFVSLHYLLAERNDADFWRAMQAPGRCRKRVKAKLDFWQLRPPSPSDFEDADFAGEADAPTPDGGYPGGPPADDRPPRDTGGLFGLPAWEAVLYGAGALADACDRWYGSNRPRACVLPDVARQVAAAMSEAVPQDAWLRQVCGMKEYGE